MIITQKVSLKIPDESRHIKVNVNYPDDNKHLLQQLVIVATGLGGHMDQPSQIDVVQNYVDAGIAPVVQFNFGGHGEGENKRGPRDSSAKFGCAEPAMSLTPLSVNTWSLHPRS